jgi:uncharacterized protein
MPTIEEARAWYSETDPIHGFDHVLRVYALAEYLARSEDGDVEIVRAATLLHDIDSHKLPEPDTDSGQTQNNKRLEHHLASAEFAARVLEDEGWSHDRIAAVTHCIRAHRFRDEREHPETLEAQILYDADKLDAIGAIGVARAIAYSVKSGSPIYTQPSGQFEKTGRTEPGEAHSAYHEYLFKLCKIKERLFTHSGRAIAEERHRFMREYFEQLSAELNGEL